MKQPLHTIRLAPILALGQGNEDKVGKIYGVILLVFTGCCTCCSIIPVTLGLISLLFGFYGGTWCRLVSISVNYDYRYPISGSQPKWLNILPEAEFGLFLRRKLDIDGFYVGTDGVFVIYQDTCDEYDNLYESADSLWMAAMVLQTVSFSSALGLCALLLMSMCCSCSRRTYRLIGVAFLVLSAIPQGLVFIVLLSNMCMNNPQLSSTFRDQAVYQNSCSLTTGGFLCIIAVIGYVLTGLCCCCLQGSKAESDQAIEDVDDNVGGSTFPIPGASPVAITSSDNMYEFEAVIPDSQSVLSENGQEVMSIKEKKSMASGEEFDAALNDDASAKVSQVGQIQNGEPQEGGGGVEICSFSV